MSGRTEDAGRNPRQIAAHYARKWGSNYSTHRFSRGPIADLGPYFEILAFPPRHERQLWTYATVGMSQASAAGETYGLELHLFAPTETEAHVELLTALAHYHVTGTRLGWGHTVNFGRPWYPESICSYGLLSIPYMDWPEVQWLGEPQASTQFLWLVPITESERDFKRAHGLEALEAQFEAAGLDFVDIRRKSVVSL